MEHLLFAGYLILFTWLVTKTGFFTRSGLTTAQLVSVFLLKVLAGIFYGWIGVYYGNMARMVDTWMFHYQSLDEAKLLATHPTQYFAHFFESGYANGFGGFLGDEKSWWNNLDVNAFLKLMGIFNAASFGHYYVNVIFYAFLSLFGPIALYRIYRDVFPRQPIQVFLAVFFIPSFIYWTSGLHKEGLLFNAIALMVYIVYFGLKGQRLTWLRALVFLISIVVLLALRSYLLLMLVPALIAWFICRKLPWKPLYTMAGLYTFFIILFFTAPLLSPALDFPGAVVSKQEQFLKLTGGSEVAVTPLQPNLSSFAANAPQAFDLALLRPHFSDIHHLLSLAAAVEINLLLSLFLIYLIWNWRRLQIDSFSLFCLAFSLSALLVIGYTVNFVGAIVRYRSVLLPLLFVPVMVQVPWRAAAQLVLNISNKNN